jgi:parvulin-like peptidyl-prolyl isomerase
LLAAAASPPPERLEHVVKRGGAEVKFTNVAPGWLRSPDQVATASASAKPLAGATPDNALVPSLSGKSPAEVAAALSAKLSNLTASGNAADLAPNPDALPPEVARRLGDSPSKWGAAVGDRVLPPASVRKRADAMLTLDPSSGAKSNRELLEQRIAEDWAERVAVATEARRRGITVTPEDMQRCRALLRERNGARFEEALRQAGFTDAEIEQEVQDLALAEKFVDSVFAEKFDDAKIRQVYEATPEEFVPSRRLRVSEIFKARPSDAAAARRTAAEMERLQREAAAGADFGALAEKHSESDSRRNRGDLGWLDASDRITPQMADALSELKPGGVSRVVQTADGFAIYKLEAIEEPKPGYEGAKPLVVAAIRKAIRLSAYDEAKKQTIVRIGSEVQKPRSAIAAEKKTAGRKTASARHGTRPSASEKQGQPPPAQANAGPRAITPDEFQRPAEPAPTPATPRRGWFRRQ